MFDLVSLLAVGWLNFRLCMVVGWWLFSVGGCWLSLVLGIACCCWLWFGCCSSLVVIVDHCCWLWLVVFVGRLLLLLVVVVDCFVLDIVC